jgi:hypothetical protein
MTPADPFIDALLAQAESDPQVIGLVLAGSSAQTERRDQWSDHDFLMITADGTPEHYRTDLSWLPDHDSIGFSFRETAHGLKVVYRSGLILEFAVFDRAEFAGCALNHYRVVLDRGGITALASTVHDRSIETRPADRATSLRLFLSLVLIGTGRARRGERLSANVMIRDYATAHLLRLLADLLPVEDTAVLDVLDPWRRFESAAPALAAGLDHALSQPIDDVGLALIAQVDPHLRAHWPDYPADDTDLVVHLLTM